MRDTTGRIGGSNSAGEGIEFHNPVVFWLGCAAVTVGVILHFPMFLMASSMGYRLAGMPMTPGMELGMFLIVAGIVAAIYGVLPRVPARGGEAPVHLQFKAMDDARLSATHWGLLLVLMMALVIDIMKPATLGFVIPGMRAEYGLTTAQIAKFPIIALTGTVLGSLMWGILSDRIGRRASIVIAAILFMGTSICGFMPSFQWNLFMCFMMGVSAGGMLPIVYALISETVPAKRRGWLVVLQAGLGTAFGYLAASGAAAALEAHYSWRILWVLGLPTGGILILLNHWIPESPRFLLSRGRTEQARRIMARFGVVAVPEAPAPPSAGAPRAGGAGLLSLFGHAYVRRTLTVGIYALAWGLVNWGFLTFLPTILRDMGYASANTFLFQSALLAVPGTFLAAWLYGYWSSRKSMTVYALATAVILGGFALLHAGPSSHLALVLLTGGLLVASNGVIAMVSPYTAEIYPTALRGTGSGFSAASSKLGGVIGPVITAGVLGGAPGFLRIALVMAVPMLAAAAMVAAGGLETRGRTLEDLTLQPVAETAGD